MQEEMGRNSRGVRVKVQGFVKATVESFSVSSHLGSLTQTAVRSLFSQGPSMPSFKVTSNKVTTSMGAMPCSRTLLSKPC